MFGFLFVLYCLLDAESSSTVMEVVVGKEFFIDLPRKSGFTWELDTDFEVAGFVSYVSDYVDRSRPKFQRFVFKSEKLGHLNLSFIMVPLGEIVPLIFNFPKKYQIHVVEPADKHFQVVVGSEAVIDIMENPTTGYTWELLDETYAVDGCLSYVRDFRFMLDGGESTIGAPTIHRFVFHGEKSGSGKVLFVQSRFGEVDINAVPESYFILVVEKPDIGMISVNKSLEVAVGDELLIDLEENPSTGYVWSLSDEGYAVNGLLSYVRDFILSNEPMMTHRFIFRGEKSGYATVSFSVARLGKDLPRQYEVRVVEKPDGGVIGPLD